MLLKQQQQARSRLRQQRLRIAFFGYLIVLVFFAVLQFIGVYFFSKGFLLTRQVLPNVAECGDAGCFPASQFDKTVLLVIDALRFDFVIPVEGSEADPYYHNNFPVLYDLMKNQPDNAILLKFLADPPTTTLQRLKGLTTGSLPTFIDAGSNFDGDAIDEDNWLLQLHKRNKSIAFMGDDTWKALFSHYINPDLHFPYDSLNVGDLHTVDNGVIEHLFPLLNKSRSKEWDVLIGHFLGVDHVGHRHGPHHHAMKDKLHQMNQVIEDVISKIDDKTLLIVMGDHGMDPTGNHGGDSAEELESAIFFYSKNRKFHINKHDASAYDTSNCGQNYRAVDQIDLVPTISLLLGMPVPHNNLGFPIDEVFGNNKDLSLASHITIEQINNLRLASSELKLEQNEKFTEKYEFISEHYSKYGKNKKYFADLIAEAKSFHAEFLEHCKGLWARFDLILIGLGISVMLLSLSFVLTYSRSIPSVRVLTMSFEFIGSIIAMTLLGIVSSISIFIVLRPSGVTLRTCLLLGCAIGISIGFWAPIMDRFSLVWLWHQINDFFHYNLNVWSAMGLIMVLFHSMIFASNSYVIWEDKLVNFFLSTFGFCCLGGCLKSSKPSNQRYLGAMHAATFILMSRLVSTINLCREEQREHCTPTFKTSWWTVLVLHLCSYLLPSTIKSFYKLSSSYHSAGPLWIGTGMKFLMIMNASYWTIEYIENNDYFQLNAKSFLDLGLTESLKLGIARIVLFIALILANFSWSRGPLCVKIELSENLQGVQVESSSDSSDENEPEMASPVPRQPRSPAATILGYGNVYGSSYFLLVINVICAVLLVTKPLGAISLSMMVVQLLSLLEIYDILGLQRNLVAVIIFCLLGYQHFFSTGHQATIPSIQWEIGFMTTQTILFPFTHLNILLNTFGSFFIICIAVPLITLWRIPPSTKPITLLSQIVTNVTTLLTYQTVISIMSFIFAAHFRRHLMVWKIFAPRFMLSALLLIVFNVTLTFGTMWFATSRVLTQVNRIFGK